MGKVQIPPGRYPKCKLFFPLFEFIIEFERADPHASKVLLARLPLLGESVENN